MTTATRNPDAGHFVPKQMARSVLRRLARMPTYLAGRIGHRSPRVWVFGNRNGFRDAPRYLAEHVVANCRDIDAWWIATSRQDADHARAAGVQVALAGDPDAARLQRRAGVAFLCNGFNDLDAQHLGGAFVVHLFHATALKRTGLDVDFERLGGGGLLARLATRAYRFSMTVGWRQVNLFVAPGELAKKRYLTSFRCPPSRVAVLGTPRFDVIGGGPVYDRVAGPDLPGRLGLLQGDRLALWLPTWREHGDAGWLPPLSASEFESQLGDLNVTLLVKPHPYSDWGVYAERLPDHPRVRLLEHEDVDVNALLHLADVLITDYSSASFDYSILRRPIHFLAPDLEEYSAGRDLYQPFDEVTGGHHHRDWSSLLASIRQGIEGTDPVGLANAARVASIGASRDEPGSSDRIVAAARRGVGLPVD